jgi:hypothetical protein
VKSKFILESDELDKEDLRALLQSVRDCEIKNFPNKLISIMMYVPELSEDDTKGILTSIKPPYEVGPMVFRFKERGK